MKFINDVIVLWLFFSFHFTFTFYFIDIKLDLIQYVFSHRHKNVTFFFLLIYQGTTALKIIMKALLVSLLSLRLVMGIG